MNIFPLELNSDGAIDWERSAQSLDNLRVNKMLIEGCQMMCSSLNIIHGEKIAPYRTTHKNHPCTKWVMESSANFNCVLQWSYALLREFLYRKGITRTPELSDHKCFGVLKKIEEIAELTEFDNNTLTPHPFCMPDEFKNGNVVESYRNYYVNKSNMTYPENRIPDWFAEKRTLPYKIVGAV